MATILFRERAGGFLVRGAGTHVIEGQPMSVRTRTALAELGLKDPSHRSAQLWEPDARKADLLIAMAPDHVPAAFTTRFAVTVPRLVMTRKPSGRFSIEITGAWS